MDYILENIFPDDLFMLANKIAKRQLNKIIMNFRITSNPHMEEQEARKLGEELFEKHRDLWGLHVEISPLDTSAFDTWRDEMKKESNSITAK